MFDVTFTNADGERPVLIHRSVMSTMERLVALLTERFAGAFPVWLAPVQLVVLPVDDAHAAAAATLRARAAADGGRVEVLAARHSLGARVRRAQERKVPFMAVIGDREVADGTASVRRRAGVHLGPRPHAAVVDLIGALASSRALGLDRPDRS